MADVVAHVQGRHVRRCVVTAPNGGANLLTLVINALNAQAPRRGDAIRPWIMGGRIITASDTFNVQNPDGTGSIAISTSILPYDIAAVDALADTRVAGNNVTLGVEVYYTGHPNVP